MYQKLLKIARARRATTRWLLIDANAVNILDSTAIAKLDDLREEVAKQLLHLERQAATAEKYQRLKAEERQLDAELKALRWRALDQDLRQRDQELSGQELALEADLRHALKDSQFFLLYQPVIRLAQRRVEGFEARRPAAR